MSSAKAAIAGAIVLGFLGQQLYSYGRKVERQACDLGKVAAQAAVATTAVTEQGAHRAAEDQRADAREKASNAHLTKIQALEADLRAVGAERDGLRRATAAAQRRAAKGLAAQGQAAEQSRAAVAALGAVLGACQERYEDVAAAADRAIAAGQLCEAEHAADVELTAGDAGERHGE